MDGLLGHRRRPTGGNRDLRYAWQPGFPDVLARARLRSVRQQYLRAPRVHEQSRTGWERDAETGRSTAFPLSRGDSPGRRGERGYRRFIQTVCNAVKARITWRIFRNVGMSRSISTAQVVANERDAFAYPLDSRPSGDRTLVSGAPRIWPLRHHAPTARHCRNRVIASVHG